MAEELAEAIDSGGLHLTVSNAMLTEAKIGKAIDQVRVADTEPEDTSLWAIEAGAGDGDAVVEIASEMLDQGDG